MWLTLASTFVIIAVWWIKYWEASRERQVLNGFQKSSY
jgi:cbb3-type cytochrome oxidase subunit 3